jgi:hypothetical protein
VTLIQRILAEVRKAAGTYSVVRRASHALSRVNGDYHTNLSCSQQY